MAKLPILVYHHVAELHEGTRYPKSFVRPAQFEAQMRYLARVGYRSISLDEYVAYRARAARLPPNPIVITFDDGYRSVRDGAFPVLQRFGFTATVFVVSGLLGGTNQWDADEPQVPLLNVAEIRELQRGGLAFQSHTRSHARLPTLSDAEALAELRDSRLALEDVLGTPVRAICYPYAAHTPHVEQLAREAGYEAGVKVRRRMNRDTTELLALRRIAVSYRTSLPRFAWDLFRLRFHGD